MPQPLEPILSETAMSTPALKGTPAMRFEQVVELARKDMAGVDRIIRTELRSDVVLINQIANHIVSSGGKRLRPMLVLLASRACHCSGNQHQRLAAVIEFIHTATLLHDDVVDESDLRRGQASANALWGNPVAVLSGDFLYSRAFQMMVSINRMAVQRILADTTNRIAEGEVLQLMAQHNPDVGVEQYMTVIGAKTASLFAAAAELGAVITDQDESIHNALRQYGHNMGLAFQITDDVLDYDSTAGKLGKNVGDDLAEGKPTLPVIHAMAAGSMEQQSLIRSALQTGDSSRLAEIIQIMHRTDSLRSCMQVVHEATEKAIAHARTLPATPYRDALIALAHYAGERRY